MSIRTESETTDYLVPHEKKETRTKRAREASKFCWKLPHLLDYWLDANTEKGYEVSGRFLYLTGKGELVRGRRGQQEGGLRVAVHRRMLSPLPWLYVILW